jgi:hypothetical protein
VAPSAGLAGGGTGREGYDSYIEARLRSGGVAEPQRVEVVALGLFDSAEHRVGVVRDANVATGQPIGATGGKRLDQARGLDRVGPVAGCQAVAKPSNTRSSSEQRASDAAALSVVDDFDCHLGDAGTSGNPYVSGAAEDLTRVVKRNERDVVVVVDRGHVPQFGGSQGGGQRQEAPVAEAFAEACVGARECLGSLSRIGRMLIRAPSGNRTRRAMSA